MPSSWILVCLHSVPTAHGLSTPGESEHTSRYVWNNGCLWYAWSPDKSEYHTCTSRIAIQAFNIDKLPGDMLSKLKSPPKTANITSSQSVLVLAARKLSNTSLAWSRATPIYGCTYDLIYLNLHHVPSHSCNSLALVQSIVTRSRHKSYN